MPEASAIKASSSYSLYLVDYQGIIKDAKSREDPYFTNFTNRNKGKDCWIAWIAGLPDCWIARLLDCLDCWIARFKKIIIINNLIGRILVRISYPIICNKNNPNNAPIILINIWIY